MTTDERFGRNLAAWLQEDSAHRVPDHLAEVLVHTTATRQRTWWSSPERWLPVDTTFHTPTFSFSRAGRLLLVAALLIAILALAILAAGSRRPSVPAPFGPARNGDFVTSRNGDLYLVDPVTSESRQISSEGYDFSPIFSRDGTKVAFLRSDGTPSSTPGVDVFLTMYVSNADGSDVRPITPSTKDLSWFDWSPDSRRVAYMAAGQLFVVDVVIGEPRLLVGTGNAHYPTWLPPDGKEIVFRAGEQSPALWAIPADGTGKRRLLSKTPANNMFDFQAIALSPDGSHLTFTRWASNVPDVLDAGWWPKLYALDLDTGKEILLPAAAGTGQRGGAVYSPDGTLVAYARIYRDGWFQMVIANADGSGNERVMGEKKRGPRDGSSVDATWAFTPDGTALLIRYGSDRRSTTHLVPLDGSAPTELLESGGFEFVDVQRLAR